MKSQNIILISCPPMIEFLPSLIVCIFPAVLLHSTLLYSTPPHRHLASSAKIIAARLLSNAISSLASCCNSTTILNQHITIRNWATTAQSRTLFKFSHADHNTMHVCVPSQHDWYRHSNRTVLQSSLLALWLGLQARLCLVGHYHHMCGKYHLQFAFALLFWYRFTRR